MNNDRLKFRVWDEKCREYIEQDCNECSIRFDGRLVAGVYVDDGYVGKYDYYEQSDVIIEQSR